MDRVPYVKEDDLEPEYQELIVSSLQPGKRVNVYSAIGNNPKVLSGYRAFLGALWTDSGLSDRQRELIILTVSSDIGSEYEWHQHVNIATNIGIDIEDIQRIARGQCEVFSIEEQTLMAYARAVVRGQVTDVLHAEVSKYLDPEEIVGAVVTAAGYLALGRTIDALGVTIEADEKFIGWDPE